MNFQDHDAEIAQILLNLPCSFWWIDRDHKHLGCNVECCALLGLTPEKIIGKDILEYGISKAHLKPLVGEIYNEETKVMDTGIDQFQAMYAYDPVFEEKKIRQLCARVPLFDIKRTKILGMIGAGILEKEYNYQLKVELAKLSPDQFILKNHPTINFKWSEMLHMFPASIWWIDRDHKYRGANLAYCRTINKKLFPTELIGKTIIDIGKMSNWPESKSKNIRDLDESLMSMNHIGYNVENIIPQGKDVSSIRQIIAKKPILDKNGKVVGLMCVAVYNGLFGEKSKW